MPARQLALFSYAGLRWDQNPFLTQDGNIPYFSAPNSLQVDTRNRLGPRMYTDKGTPDLRLLSLKCRWWIYNQSPLQVVGVLLGVVSLSLFLKQLQSTSCRLTDVLQEQYSIDLNCVRGGQDSNNNFYWTYLPFVDSM